jgi:Holliday junction resolvase-like predicted endonuclease
MYVTILIYKCIIFFIIAIGGLIAFFKYIFNKDKHNSSHIKSDYQKTYNKPNSSNSNRSNTTQNTSNGKQSNYTYNSANSNAYSNATNGNQVNDEEIRLREAIEAENYVASLLRKIPGVEVYQNVYLPCDTGFDEFTEIDIIVVSSRGCYIVEVKNRSGIICGGYHDKKWKQVKKYQTKVFENPIHQNRNHLRIFNKNFPKAADITKSVIVYSNKAVIENVMGTYPDAIITNTNNIAGIIHQDINQSKLSLTAEEVNIIKKSIMIALSKVTQEQKDQHLKKIKEKYGTED